MTTEKMIALPALTSLRFFAALAIVVHHCNGVFWAAADLGPLDVGVSFFFVLSGFILTYVYRDISLGAASLGKFYLARIARIWPLHLVCLLLTILFVTTPEPFDLGVLVSNALLLQAWIPFDRYFFSYNYVSWSISTELFFYLVFPFLMVHARRWIKLSVLLALLMVALLALVSDRAHLSTWNTAHNHLSSTGLLYADPLARLAEFLIGIATAVKFLKESHGADTVDLRWTIYEIASVGLLVLGYGYFLLGLAPLIHWVLLSVGASTLALASLAEENALLPQLSPFANMVVTEWASHVALAPFAALVIYVFAQQRGALSRVLSHPLLVFLGEISFALYLVHQLALRFMQQHVDHLDGGDFALFIGSVLLMAALLHLLIEKPLRRWLTARHTFASDASLRSKKL